MKTARIAVTGAGGQIAYSLLFRLCKGELLGPETDIELSLLELPETLKALEGVKMELEDCAFPILKKVTIGSNASQMFEGADFAFLVGAKPRGPGMERKQLLEANAKIFVAQGKALNETAKKSVKVLIVGNPCNTNCLITLHSAPDINPKQFFAMTMLDELRAKNMLAKKASVPVDQVTRLAIWGNHSSTQVPDFENAKIKGKALPLVITDRAWLEGPFFEQVQQRGAAIIAARGKSSAASAAHAALEQMKAFITPSLQDNDFFSGGVFSEGNAYDIDNNLIFSFPLRSNGREWEVVNGIRHDAFFEKKIRQTEKELQEERDMALSLIGV